MDPIQIISSDEEEDDRGNGYGRQAHLDDLDVPFAPNSSSAFSPAAPNGPPSSNGCGPSNYFTSIGGSSSSSFFSGMRPATTATSAGQSNFNWRLSLPQASIGAQSPVYRAAMRPPHSANMWNSNGTSHPYYSSFNNNHLMHDHKGGIIRPPAQQSFLNGSSAPSNHYANPIRPQSNMIPKERKEAPEERPRSPPPPPPMEKQEAPEERPDENEERVIFMAALKDLEQPTGEIDPPKGALSVPLFRHQKMALAWMVEKEKGAGVCVGGILADDQGLGKTIAMTALIQMQRSLQEEHKSGKDASTSRLEPLDDGEDKKVATAPAKLLKPKVESYSGKFASAIANLLKPTVEYYGDKFASAFAMLKPKVEYDDDTEEISKRRPLIPESATGTPVVKPEALILEDDEGKKAPSGGPLELKPKVQSFEVEKILRKIDSGYKPAAGTLVVCPTSVLRQWARELDEKVTEESKLSVLVYHGSKRTSDPVDLAKYDVVLTTYSLVAMEVPKQPLVGGGGDNKENYVLSSTTKKRKKKSKKKKGKKGRCSDDSACGALAKVHWFRVILDEAHIIKNHRTKVARACCSLKAKSRWCLSGTPIQNEIEELYSYFRFLRHNLYSNYTKFVVGVKESVAGDSERGFMRLRYVMKAIMLRRTKGTLIDGKPILNLPPKTTHLNGVDFSDEEWAFYDTLERKYSRQFMAYAAEGTISKNYATILVMLLRLRQACDHPILVINGSRNGRESLEIAKSLPAEKLQSLLGVLENYSATCSVCSDQPQNAVVTTCGHVCCHQCGLDYLADEASTCPEAGCEEEINADALFTEEILQLCLSNDLDSDNSSSFVSSVELTCLKNGSSSKIKAALQILQSCCKPSVPKPEINELKHWNGDASLENGFPAGSQISKPTKAIVFSQWTGMLDLVEDKLCDTNLKYRRLDGSMSLLSRDMAVKDFNTRPEVTVMLMSLKAGNLGLNMVAACHVILLDPWWNPTTEDQAVDRAHRIGQTRPVTITRLTITNSIEDRILALQEKKRKLVSSVLGQEQSGGSASRLTEEDLRSLFNLK